MGGEPRRRGETDREGGLPTARSALSRIFLTLTDALDRHVGWVRLPRPLAAVTLIGLRQRLREKNLYDTETAVSIEPVSTGPRGPADPRQVAVRTVDGSYNDVDWPRMGSVGCRFGRNVPLERTHPDRSPLSPNPRVVSRTLLTRERFEPATSLNVLAAAWIQFEVHDWFSHERDPASPWEVDLDPGDPWPENPMRIQRTRRSPVSGFDPAGAAPTFVTSDSHWWDASQLYGTAGKEGQAFADRLRLGRDGKLRIGEDGLPPIDLDDGLDPTGVAGNTWTGLALLHTLFMREHNAICHRLRQEYPGWSDEHLYDKARLVNAALMAKIHTVEWTPAIIAHPTTRFAMNTNWWGLVGSGAVGRRLRSLSSRDIWRGIPGSATDHHGVAYSLTEEFVAVYRMHPLMPDEFIFRSLDDDSVLRELVLPDLGLRTMRGHLEDLGAANSLYSLGVAHPGAITLHNYPRFLQHLERPDGETVDLAATDVLRIRERGVPRYNEFRRLFRLRPARTFEDLSDNPQWVEEISHVYGGEVEEVDLMVGLYAEPKPPGFGFSDTAFRVFVLMASRRLKSDRFFTTDYTPKTYTPVGLDWISRNTMSTVLLRHYPDLEPALRGVSNAFAPWNRVS